MTFQKCQKSKKNKTDESETCKMDKSVRKNSFFDKIITKMINWIKKYRIFVQISDNIYT